MFFTNFKVVLDLFVSNRAYFGVGARSKKFLGRAHIDQQFLFSDYCSIYDVSYLTGWVDRWMAEFCKSITSSALAKARDEIPDFHPSYFNYSGTTVNKFVSLSVHQVKF